MFSHFQNILSEADLKILFGEKITADDIFVKLAEKKEDGVRPLAREVNYHREG